MRRRIVSIRAYLVLALVFCAPAVLADGKIFSNAVAHVEIPGQSALIGFDGEEELLVIETRYEGEGDNLAWVIPLPAPPTSIEKSTRGLFPTLRSVFRPYLVRQVARDAPSVVFLLVLCGTLWVAVVFRRSAVAGVLLVALWMALPLLYAAGYSPGVRNTEAAEMGVTVHNRERVGSYEVAALSTKNADALYDWLRANGYVVPKTIRPALADYSTRGWVFVAARLADGFSGREENVTHPLAFRFPTEKTIYPLMLTGVGNDSLRLDLYVFSDRRAVAPPLACERAGRLVDHDEQWPWHQYFTALPVQHDEFGRLVAPYAFGTKLVGTLSPSDMNQDLAIHWSDPVPRREKRYLPTVVPRMLLLPGAGVAVAITALWLLCFLWTQRTNTTRTRIPRALPACFALAAGAVVCGHGATQDLAGANATFWLLAAGALLCALGILATLAFVRGKLVVRTGVILYVLAMAALPSLATGVIEIDSLVPRATLFALTLVFILIGHPRVSGAGQPRTPRESRLHRRALVTLAAAFLLVTFIQSLHALPHIEDPPEGVPSRSRASELLNRIIETAGAKAVWKMPPEEVSPIAARAAEQVSRYYGDRITTFIEEDSPGNYTIDPDDAGWSLTVHGSWGEAAVTWDNEEIRDIATWKRRRSSR